MSMNKRISTAKELLSSLCEIAKANSDVVMPFSDQAALILSNSQGFFKYPFEIQIGGDRIVHIRFGGNFYDVQDIFTKDSSGAFNRIQVQFAMNYKCRGGFLSIDQTESGCYMRVTCPILLPKSEVPIEFFCDLIKRAGESCYAYLLNMKNLIPEYAEHFRKSDELNDIEHLRRKLFEHTGIGDLFPGMFSFMGYNFDANFIKDQNERFINHSLDLMNSDEYVDVDLRKDEISSLLFCVDGNLKKNLNSLKFVPPEHLKNLFTPKEDVYCLRSLPPFGIYSLWADEGSQWNSDREKKPQKINDVDVAILIAAYHTQNERMTALSFEISPDGIFFGILCTIIPYPNLSKEERMELLVTALSGVELYRGIFETKFASIINSLIKDEAA